MQRPRASISPAVQTRTALLMAPRARRWLAEAPQARVLNVFARACNLVDERGAVLSLVSPQHGAGPFSLVLDGELDFRALIGERDRVTVRPGELLVGGLRVDASQAQIWPARPDWGRLHAGKDRVIARLPLVSRYLLEESPAGSLAGLLREPGLDDRTDLSAALVAAAREPARRLVDGIAGGSLQAIRRAARRLAGLGPGLTPAGDDFLLGAAYALRVLYSAYQADELAVCLSEVAIPRTTMLSAAWLRAAACGEAGERWHGFLDAMTQSSSGGLIPAVRKLLSGGHTSGADALAGFAAVARCPRTLRSVPCHS